MITENNVQVRYLRSNELYDIFEVIYFGGNIYYPEFPRSSCVSEHDVLYMYL